MAVTPRKGGWLSTTSRPLSANSLRARCTSLEENARKNHQALQTHRLEIGSLAKLREEGRRRLIESLHENLSPQALGEATASP
mmetsp:Transcript_46752/g.108090  ORF Transcript_46752/g.108090 Transcript_46752/m.108090 type:complete len:83 (-) Transcript_46752:129-377(-)